MVRAGSGSYLIEEFLEKSVVAIGWNDINALGEGVEYNELKSRLSDVYEDWSSGRLNQSTGQIWRFYHDFSIGDKVVTYDSVSRVYYIGEIKSTYRFSNRLEHKHYREVEWSDGYVERDELQVDSKNTLGSIMTVFELSHSLWDDLVQSHPGYVSPKMLEDLEEMSEHYEKLQLEQLKEDAIFRSVEFIKDIFSLLTWKDVELVVAGLLRAMGYKTRMTTRGADLGSDILASPDGLEMVEPIIKVEVKHKIRSKEKVSAPDLRNFIGGLRTPTKGLYVSTTGFSKEANYEAQRANFPITLVDLDLLVELVVEYYESLDLETKSLVPLRKIYWPV